METYETRISDFMHFSFPPANADEEYAAHRNLLDTGVIDSIGVLTVVTWLEQEFGFMVEDEEVVPENLASIASLTRYVESKLAGVETGLAG